MNTMKTFFLLALLTVGLVLAGDVLAGRQGMTIALIFAGVMNLVMFFFADKIVLKMYHAQPLPDTHWLHASAERLSRKAGIPKPRLFIVDNPQPNAFATGRSPAKGVVAVTSGLLQLMSTDEAEGVLAHEMSHIKNRDTLVMVVAATLAGAITYLATMAKWAMIFGGGGGRDNDRGGGNPIALIAMMILAPLAAMLIQLAISRSREFGADEGAKEVMGSPMPLVNALKKLDAASQRLPMDTSPAMAHLFIVNPLGGRGAMMSLFMTHPPVEKRIAKLLGRD